MKAQAATKPDSFRQNLLALYLVQAASYVIPLLVLPFLVRAVGIERFGLIAFAQAVAQYFVFAVDAGFNNNAAREIAVRRDQPGAVLEVYWATQAVRGVVLLLSTILFLVLLYWVPSLTAHWQLYLVSFAAVWGTYAFSPWLYQGLEQMRLIAVLQVGGRLIAGAALLLLVREPDDYVLAGGLQASATLISGILGLAVCFRKGLLRWQRPRMTSIRAMLQQGGRLFWSEFLGTCVSSSGVFVLGLVASNAVIGAYAAVEKLIRAVMTGYLPLSQALLPRAANLLSSAPLAERAWRWMVTLTLAALVSASVGAGMVSVYADDILAIAFGPDLVAYGMLLVLMIWILPIDVANVALGQLFVFAAGYRKSYADALATAAAVQGAVSLALILPLGAYGIAIAFLAGELCMAGMLLRATAQIRRRPSFGTATAPGGAAA